MAAITYERATQSLAQTIRALTEEARGKLDEDNQSPWDMANGAVRAWRDMFGADVQVKDVAAIVRLVDELAAVDRAGAGAWHLTPVLHLR